MNSKERCLAAMAGRPVDRTPVFPLLMFLAADRAGMTYRQYATSGESLAEAQLLMHERYGVDVITACSDAFRVSADLGGQMAFPESTPPHLVRPIVASEADVRRLGRPDPRQAGSRMADRARGVEIMARAAGERCLILGWVDMPFAEACSICGVQEFMMMLYDAPDVAHRLLEHLTGIVIDFSLAQLEAGAPMIGAGDAATSLVSPAAYREFALPYERRVCEAVHARGGLVKLHVCGNTASLLSDMATCGADLFNVDHMVDFGLACRVYGSAGKCFKGNLDPVSEIMQASPEQVRRLAQDRIRAARGLRYMLSAGCEIPAQTSDEAFRAFCEAPQGVEEERGA